MGKDQTEIIQFYTQVTYYKKEDDSEGIRRQKAEPRTMEENSQGAELSPTHRTGNMCLAGIQNFYRPM